MKSTLILALCTIFCFTSSLFGQETHHQKAKLKSQHVAFLTAELELTPEESEKFWPVYNEYTKERSLIKKANRKPISTESMSEKEAQDHINEMLLVDQKMIDLKKSYYQKFYKVLPAFKVAKIEPAERKFKKGMLKMISENKQRKRNNLPNQK